MLLTIEGIDGAGKGTLAGGLAAQARAAGHKSAQLSFPRYQETRFARLVGQYLDGRFGKLDEVPARFAALLYAGDRHESRDVLLDLLADNDLVILDRYVASNIAYGAAKMPAAERDEIIDWIRELEFDVFELPRPDLTCLVATDAALAHALVGKKAARSYTEDTHDLHEADRGYMDRVAEVYHELARRQLDAPWFTVDPQDSDGTLRPPATLCSEVWATVAAALS